MNRGPRNSERRLIICKWRGMHRNGAKSLGLCREIKALRSAGPYIRKLIEARPTLSNVENVGLS